LSPVQAIIIVSAAQAGSLQFISVSPAIGVINIGGDSAILTFKVLDVNGTPLSGQTVNFQLAVAPTGATLSPLSGSTNGSGLVTTTLTSGPVAGPVRIDATTTVPGPPVTTLAASSGALSIGGGMPSMRFLSLSVQKFNVAGLNCDGVTDQINVRMADRFGNYNIVQGTSVSFATAYGAIDASNVTDASGATSSLWHSQDPRPANGLVAILVQTTGEENFVDLNGNGVYDLVGDTFIASDPNYDLPEPFIDNDGNGTHIAGELFFNWPAGVTGNDVTQYDGPNDVWDARIPIFKNVYIWMTGPPAVGAALSHIACCDPAVNPICASGAAVTTPITIPAGGSTVCYVYSSDVNNNALIGGTTVSMNASTTDATITNYSGFTTFVDHIVTGPEITGFLVRNTAAAPPVNVILSATINWTGTCEGNVNVPFSYPGTVTLQPAPPAAPAGVIATAGPGAGEITITWNAVSGATSYNLYWGTAPGATTNQITGVASPYVHTGRTTGTTYYYAVTAVNTGGESAKSSEVNAVAP
jgi:hypothetical protein